MNLYKYRSDSEYTERIFTTGKVWLSTPALLNDPFEGSFQQLTSDWISTKVRELKLAQLSGFIYAAHLALVDHHDFFGLSGKPLVEFIESFRTLSEAERDTAYRDFVEQRLGNPPSNPEDIFNQFEEQLNKVGIFSLSEVPDNELMWSHYADSHRGICIGFETSDGSLLANGDHCLEVRYINDIPSLEGGFTQQTRFALDEDGGLQSSSCIPFSDPTLQAAISTKSEDWAYEQEWRYVESEAGEYPWPSRVVEVVFGMRCPPDRRSHYVSLVERFVTNDVRFYEIRKVEGGRSLERRRLRTIG